MQKQQYYAPSILNHLWAFLPVALFCLLFHLTCGEKKKQTPCIWKPLSFSITLVYQLLLTTVGKVRCNYCTPPNLQLIEKIMHSAILWSILEDLNGLANKPIFKWGKRVLEMLMFLVLIHTCGEPQAFSLFQLHYSLRTLILSPLSLPISFPFEPVCLLLIWLFFLLGTQSYFTDSVLNHMSEFFPAQQD